MKTKLEIAKNWLPRYTGTQISELGDYMLLTNFQNYVEKFADRFKCNIKGLDRPMQTANNSNGLSIINFGMGSANAATLMDLLVARKPKGVLFLGLGQLLNDIIPRDFGCWIVHITGRKFWAGDSGRFHEITIQHIQEPGRMI